MELDQKLEGWRRSCLDYWRILSIVRYAVFWQLIKIQGGQFSRQRYAGNYRTNRLGGIKIENWFPSCWRVEQAACVHVSAMLTSRRCFIVPDYDYANHPGWKTCTTSVSQSDIVTREYVTEPEVFHVSSHHQPGLRIQLSRIVCTQCTWSEMEVYTSRDWHSSDHGKNMPNQ